MALIIGMCGCWILQCNINVVLRLYKFKKKEKKEILIGNHLHVRCCFCTGLQDLVPTSETETKTTSFTVLFSRSLIAISCATQFAYDQTHETNDWVGWFGRVNLAI